MSDELCETCGIGYYLPSGVCDHCNVRQAHSPAPLGSVAHVRQSAIVCPHCGYKYMESWEFDDVGEAKCCQCGKGFSHYRDIVYTTEPLNAELTPLEASNDRKI